MVSPMAMTTQPRWSTALVVGQAAILAPRFQQPTTRRWLPFTSG